MKLSRIVAITNEFDKANAGCSYGKHHSHLEPSIRLLCDIDRQAVANLANSLHEKRRESARNRLEQEMGITVDSEYPHDYRFMGRQGTVYVKRERHLDEK